MAPNDPEPAWLPWPAHQRMDNYFCFKYRRTVGNDNSVRFANLVLDIPKPLRGITFAHARVDVHEGFDGTISVFHQPG